MTIYYVQGHSGEISCPKESKIEVYNQYLKFCILKIDQFIIIRHISFPFYKWASVAGLIESGYWRIWYVKCVFWNKLVILKYHPFGLNGLIFKGNIFLFIKLLTIFWAFFMTLLKVINSAKYNSKYQYIIWWREWHIILVYLEVKKNKYQ